MMFIYERKSARNLSLNYIAYLEIYQILGQIL